MNALSVNGLFGHVSRVDSVKRTAFSGRPISPPDHALANGARHHMLARDGSLRAERRCRFVIPVNVRRAKSNGMRTVAVVDEISAHAACAVMDPRTLNRGSTS